MRPEKSVKPSASMSMLLMSAIHIRPEVCLGMIENDVMAYRQVADFLNVSKIDVVRFQHELGVFGEDC